MSSDKISEAGKQFSNAFSQFASSIKPLAASAGKGLAQASQYARERVIRDADITELPAEYKTLEEKVDNVKLIHELFLKVSRNYTYPAYDYEADMGEKITDLATVGFANAFNLASKFAGNQQQKEQVISDTPPSLSHAFAKAAYQSAELVENDEPFKTALKKFAVTQEKIGNCRIQQDNDAVLKFYKPFEIKMAIKIEEAMKSRRAVVAARLTYDGLRDRVKVISPGSLNQVETQQMEAEDDFVQKVDDSMGKMKAVVDNGDSLKCLSDLVAIQLQYHKAAFEALSELSPELDELVVLLE